MDVIVHTEQRHDVIGERTGIAPRPLIQFVRQARERLAVDRLFVCVGSGAERRRRSQQHDDDDGPVDHATSCVSAPRGGAKRIRARTCCTINRPANATTKTSQPENV